MNNRSRQGPRGWDQHAYRFSKVNDDPAERSAMQSWVMCCVLGSQPPNGLNHSAGCCGVAQQATAHFKSIVFTIAGSDDPYLEVDHPTKAILVRRVDGYDGENVYMCAILEPQAGAASATSMSGVGAAANAVRPEVDLARRALDALSTCWPVMC